MIKNIGSVSNNRLQSHFFLEQRAMPVISIWQREFGFSKTDVQTRRSFESIKIL